MAETTWQVNIDRVVVTGVFAGVGGAHELRALITQRVEAMAVGARLPPGRTMRASVKIEAGTLNGADAVAGAVARGVAQALGGGRRG